MINIKILKQWHEEHYNFLTIFSLNVSIIGNVLVLKEAKV